MRDTTTTTTTTTIEPLEPRWLLAVANLVEIAFHYEAIRTAPGSIYANVAQTFLWGRIYLREIGAVV